MKIYKDKNGVIIKENMVILVGEKGFAKPEKVVKYRNGLGIFASWIKSDKRKEKFVSLKYYCNKVLNNCVEVMKNVR